MLSKYKSITGRKIRFALVGCGRISANHFGSLELHKEECELVAVCDIVSDDKSCIISSNSNSNDCNSSSRSSSSSSISIKMTSIDSNDDNDNEDDNDNNNNNDDD